MFSIYLRQFMAESSNESSNSIVVDNAKLITSVAFINICFAITIFLKKFPTNTILDKNLNLLLSASIFLFTGSAFLSYFAMAEKSYDDKDVKAEIFSLKFATYFIGITIFGIAALMILTEI